MEDLSMIYFIVVLLVIFCDIAYTRFKLQDIMTEEHNKLERKFDKAIETLMEEIKGINDTSSNDDHDTPTKLNKK